MQDTSTAFDTAIAAGSVVWTEPQVWADWANDGYGASGSIDDLSPQAGAPIVIKQAIGDGLPDDLTFTSVDEASTADAPMAWGRSGLEASQYFSRLRTDSAIYGYERDVAPVKVELGIVTASGQEYVRVFTGQMGDTPVRGRSASVQAMSAARLALGKAVQPPPINETWEGLTGTWPVSWTLAECGLYASPPPRDGCRWWAPLHGSMRAFTPSDEPSSYDQTGEILGQVVRRYTTDGTLKAYSQVPLPDPPDGLPYWIDGPYVEAPYFRGGTSLLYYGTWSDMPLADGDSLFDTGGAIGRVEFQVRGDSLNINTTPGGSAFWDASVSTTYLARVSLVNRDTAYSVAVGIRRSDRKPQISITDAGGTYSLVGSTPLPTDSAWRGIGGAWDYTANKLWLYDNGTVTTCSGLTLTEANLTASDAQLNITAALPIAEVHVTGGTQASPDSYPWVYDAGYTWTEGAQIGRSRLALQALAQTEPEEAWSYLGRLAESELASLRTDEQDVVCYRPVSWWVLNDLVDTPVDTLSTDVVSGSPGNVAALDVKFELAKVRNSATVRYTSTVVGGVDGLFEPVFSLSTNIAILPGLTALTVVFDTPAVVIANIYGTVDIADNMRILGSQAEVDAVAAAASPSAVGYSWATLNDASDGTGNYATSADVTFRIPSWHAGGAVVTFYNNSSTTYYLANDGQIAPLMILGIGVHEADATITVTDANSVAIRGERTISISAPLVRTEENATWLATAVVGEHAYPLPRVENVEVFADPRRQPGDLVRIVDTDNTGLDDQFRVAMVKHTVDGARYTQAITARQQKPTGVWDESNWDECVWGE